MKTRKELSELVIKELRGKNAGMDTIKMCVRLDRGRKDMRYSSMNLVSMPGYTKENNQTQDALIWVYDDGGRAEAGYKGATGDCVCRAIAIATETPYQEVYDLINEYAKRERTGKRKKGTSNARTGVYKQTIRKIMEGHFGWTWVPCMKIGAGCQVHLKADELPAGNLVVNCSRHSTAVIDGVIHDTYDPSRDGTRCVYGYYRKARG